MRALNIVDWKRHFETSESERIKTLAWVAIPNSMDGRGYLRLTKHKNVISTLAGWYAIVQIGSKMPHRGLLAKVDGPLTAADLSDISRLPEDMFTRAIEVLLTPDIGWLEWVEVTWKNDVAEIEGRGALPLPGRDRANPGYRQDRTDRTGPKSKISQAGRSDGAGQEGNENDLTEAEMKRIQAAGGTVYGRGDASWTGLIDDYGLETVLRAMSFMQRERDGMQDKPRAVRLWIGKNKEKLKPPKPAQIDPPKPPAGAA